MGMNHNNNMKIIFSFLLAMSLISFASAVDEEGSYLLLLK